MLDTAMQKEVKNGTRGSIVPVLKIRIFVFAISLHVLGQNALIS